MILKDIIFSYFFVFFLLKNMKNAQFAPYFHSDGSRWTCPGVGVTLPVSDWNSWRWTETRSADSCDGWAISGVSLVGKDVFGWVMQWISVMKSWPESVRCYVSWSLWGSHKDILSLQAASSVNGRDAFGYPHGLVCWEKSTPETMGNRRLVGSLEHFLFFPYIGNNHSNWLIFFRGIETTNQKVIAPKYESKTSLLLTEESAVQTSSFSHDAQAVTTLDSAWVRMQETQQ